MRFRAEAIPDSFDGSGEIISDWLEKWGREVTGFSDEGCGCCVHILNFEAPGEAIDELEQDLRSPFERKPIGDSGNENGSRTSS